MMLFFRTNTCIFLTLILICDKGDYIPYTNLILSQECLKHNCLTSILLHDRGCLKLNWHTHTTKHCFQIALLWHCSGPTDCPIAQGLVLILSMLLLFVNFNMMSFFRTHTWTLVYPGVFIPYNNLNLLQGCLKLNCLRSTFFHDMGVYNSIGTIHTGLNTRRALWEMLTSGWLHFGPRRGCAACRRWALGLSCEFAVFTFTLSHWWTNLGYNAHLVQYT